MRDEKAIKDVLALTRENVGADAVLECVGAESAIEQAGQIARPGAVIGRVGTPIILEEYRFAWWYCFCN